MGKRSEISLQDRVEKPKCYLPDIYFCPYCGNSIKENESFIVEYWNSSQNVFFCWCHNCDWRGEIVRLNRIITSEIDE